MPRRRWYHILMKLFCAFSLLAAVTFASVNPQLHGVKRVYILAMGSGMDQYLTNQLTMAGLFEVVTDPTKADAIVSDNVGESFQKKLDELYPPPPSPKVTTAATKPAADPGPAVDVGDSTPYDAKAAKKDALADVDFSGGSSRPSSLARGKGNFFVVDRASRIVLWSVYDRPRNSSPAELTKTAAQIVKRLKGDLYPKKPSE
jgi:hypothetical protein